MSDSLSMMRKMGLEQAKLAAPEAEEAEHAAFGYLRSVRDRALHIEFRLQNGNVEAFPYSWLGPVSFNPSHGIVLRFVGDGRYRVAIHGRNLGGLIADGIDLLSRGIFRHRILWIREMETHECRRSPEEALTVERIEIQMVQAEQDGYADKQ
jgi:hypothetical protein